MANFRILNPAAGRLLLGRRGASIRKSIQRWNRFLSQSVQRPYSSGSSRKSAPVHQLWKPAVFTIMVGGVAFSLSGIYAVENALHRHRHSHRRLDQDEDSLLLKLRRWWLDIGPKNRFAIGVVGFNALVLLGWRVYPLTGRFMTELFSSSIHNRGLSHLSLSTFSHHELWHFGLNMVAFYSFAGGLMYVLDDRLCCAKSLAFLVTAGTFASMIGYYNKRYQVIGKGSLGASGALYAVATLVILNNPNSNVYLIFLPFVPIKATVALSGLVALDVIGLIRGWQVFDHAVHLGGVFFALLYRQWLHKVCDQIHFKSASLWAKWRRRLF